MLNRTTLRLLSLLFILVGVTGLTTACGSQPASDDHYHMASLEDMIAEVQNAPKRVQEAYQFAVANPEAAKAIPCYCGCAALGHTNSYACYVKEVDAAGTIVYDLHAIGCGICVDITQDQMRMMRDGKGLAEIKDYVDRAYAKYGPSTGP